MKEIVKKSLWSLLLVPALVLGVSATAGAASCAATGNKVTGIKGAADCAKSADQTETLLGDGGAFTTITNILIFIVGAISVIMLVIGGVRYTVSGGDSSAVTGAKNTILYAIVGIIVSILAYAVVNFVISNFTAT
jgi:hypothetical protein